MSRIISEFSCHALKVNEDVLVQILCVHIPLPISYDIHEQECEACTLVELGTDPSWPP